MQNLRYPGVQEKANNKFLLRQDMWQLSPLNTKLYDKY